MLVPHIDGCVFCSDLAGTLVEADARILGWHADILRDLLRRVDRFYLITGQPRHDPQVVQILQILEYSPEAAVVYTTRGGCRWRFDRNRWLFDPNYLTQTRIDQNSLDYIFEQIKSLAKELGSEFLIPAVVLDECAVRMNPTPQMRPIWVKRLELRLRGKFQAVAEGRTSIFVTRLGVSKAMAMKDIVSRTSSNKSILYFGDEFEGGNDQQILEFRSVESWAVGTRPSNPLIRYVGPTPETLYTLLKTQLVKGSLS